MTKQMKRNIFLAIITGFLMMACCDEDECDNPGEAWCEDNTLFYCSTKGGSYVPNPCAHNYLSEIDCGEGVCTEEEDVTSAYCDSSQRR